MDLSQFHFAEPAWFYALLVLPALWVFYALFHKGHPARAKLERFADPHLLPHLLKNGAGSKRSTAGKLGLWSLVWLCGVLALAGPRWNYTDVETFQLEQDLVILMDLSKSMDVQDTKPSRVVRAQQEIEDILDMNKGVSIGLVAYAAVPHMITPLTDDMKTIRALLPSLDTSLVTVQGDRLQPAIEMASNMLGAENGNSKSILIVSDGNFQEDDMARLAAAAKGATLYTMGIGTAAGGPVPVNGEWLKDADGKTIIARLQSGRLQALAKAGHGLYVEADYTDRDTRTILGHIESASDNHKAAGKSARIWAERFYIPALAMALLLLPFFRRGTTFPFMLIMMISLPLPARADMADLFHNRAQQGQAAFQKGDYKTAIQKFDTPYRKGVAEYKAGQFDKAAQSFSAVNDPKQALAAQYNLGNAQLMQGQPDQAIASYEAVLKQKPDDADARHNLDIAKKMLQQKQQQNKPDQGKSGQDKDGQKNQQGQQNGAQGQGQPQQNGTQSNPPNGRSGQDQSPQPQGQNDQQQPGQQGQQNKPQPGSQGQPNGQPSQQQQGQQNPQSQGQQNQPGQQPDRQPGQQPQQPSQTPQNENGPAGTPPGANPQTAPSAQQAQDARRDADANQWLGRVQSDPGSFLKNQFLIEERQNAGGQGGTP